MELGNYEAFIAASRYARWLPKEGRRETWEETTQRRADYWFLNKEMLTEDEADHLLAMVRELKVMPSMRTLMTAGPALDRDNVSGFNCSYLPLDSQRSFDELMYVLMCGTGGGFSCEKKYVHKLPPVADEHHPTDTIVVVADSKIGWCKAFRELLALLWTGQLPKWDVSKVRPAGAPLKTFGGRASGPVPLEQLFQWTTELMVKAAGRSLTTIEAHDLACKIAEVVVVGGVRRSALISLSDPEDSHLRTAKSGQWYIQNAHRGLANNSSCYEEKPDFPFFLKECQALHESESGERGFFSRVAAQKIAGRNGRRDSTPLFGTNPCSEIILRPYQFCNLSEVVVRAEDTLDDLKEKVEAAAIIGTLQASLTDFRYLRKIWQTNTEEEALLGLSLTGIMDHPVLSGRTLPKNVEGFRTGHQLGLEEVLQELREVAIETNKIWAERLGINQAAAITCVKPSGTVSQLVNSASGIHPRFSQYYIRTVRADYKDPLAQYMQANGFPCEVDQMKDTNLVFSFPIKAPEGCVTNKDVGAMGQLRLWKTYQDSWCEHKPSITVFYTDDEYLEVCQWLWQNFDSLSGISLLPLSDHTYVQAPYQEIDEAAYTKALREMPEGINWEDLAEFESEDMTAGAQTLSCSAGQCEVVDLGGSS
mgnify:CR=1 FL=1